MEPLPGPPREQLGYNDDPRPTFSRRRFVPAPTTNWHMASTRCPPAVREGPPDSQLQPASEPAGGITTSKAERRRRALEPVVNRAMRCGSWKFKSPPDSGALKIRPSPPHLPVKEAVASLTTPTKVLCGSRPVYGRVPDPDASGLRGRRTLTSGGPPGRNACEDERAPAEDETKTLRRRRR